LSRVISEVGTLKMVGVVDEVGRHGPTLLMVEVIDEGRGRGW